VHPSLPPPVRPFVRRRSSPSSSPSSPLPPPPRRRRRRAWKCHEIVNKLPLMHTGPLINGARDAFTSFEFIIRAAYRPFKNFTLHF